MSTANNKVANIIAKVNESGIAGLDQFDRPILACVYGNAPKAIVIKSKVFKTHLHKFAKIENLILLKADIENIINDTNARAHASINNFKVYKGCAPVKGGIEIDSRGHDGIRYQITPNDVTTIKNDSKTLFEQNSTSLPLSPIANEGDLALLFPYLNLDKVNQYLLIGYTTYTLAHPRVPQTNYLHLGLISGMGTGKTFLSKTVLRNLLDPSKLGVSTLPNKDEDFILLCQACSVFFLDNITNISKNLAMLLCTSATGGVIARRQLFTDDDILLYPIHCPIVFNSIHNICTEADLAQRILQLELKTINENDRRTEEELTASFMEDLPFIQKGLFDLISKIFHHLPDAKIKYPERMIEFSRHLAAMEMALHLPEGELQKAYSESLKSNMLESLLEQPLASAIYDMANKESFKGYSDTPTSLLDELNKNTSQHITRSQDWPRTPIALSKRLSALIAGLEKQGVLVEFSRGKRRKISIQLADMF